MCKKVMRFISVMCVSAMVLAGCAGANQNEGKENETTTVAEVSNVNESTGAADSTNTGETTAAGETESTKADAKTDDVVVRVASLKGPTSIGLVKMMKDNDGSYDFGIYTAADEIVPLVVKGEVDIASIPANLAAVLYQKTQGQIEVLDINTLGVIYVVSFDKTIDSIDDLKGKTIYMTGKGTTPEYAFNYVLSQNGMSASDVTIEFKSEATEVVSALKNDNSGIGVIPQPFVTVATTQLEGLNVNISLADEWEDMLTGVTIVNKKFAEEHPEAVTVFLEAQRASVDYVNANAEEMAVVVEEYDIVKAAIAEKAIPNCNLVCIEGKEMKERLQNYLTVLFEQDAASVGGQLPGDDFYYNAQ